MKKITTVIAVAMGISQSLFGTIYTIDALDEISPHLKRANSSTLMVFDIDETLIICDDPAFHRQNYEKCVDELREIKATFNAEQIPLLPNMTLLCTQGVLLEKNTLKFLDVQREKGVKMMALSAAMSGKLDGVDMLDMRLQTFKKLGIDFSDSFPDLQEIRFENLKTFYGEKPRFKQGVIHSNACKYVKEIHNDKGEVLVEFLKFAKFTPKMVVFVDDKLELVEEMQNTLKKTFPQIEYLGFYYRGVMHYPSKEVTKEHLRARWQEVADKVKSISPQGT